MPEHDVLIANTAHAGIGAICKIPPYFPLLSYPAAHCFSIVAAVPLWWRRTAFHEAQTCTREDAKGESCDELIWKVEVMLRAGSRVDDIIFGSIFFISFMFVSVFDR